MCVNIVKWCIGLTNYRRAQQNHSYKQTIKRLLDANRLRSHIVSSTYTGTETRMYICDAVDEYHYQYNGTRWGGFWIWRVAALFIVPCDFIKRSIRVCPSINRHKGVALGFRFLYLHDKTYEHVNLRWYSYISFHMIYMYMYICIYICIMWNEITISIMLSLTSPWWPLEHANNLVIQMQILGGGVSLAHGIAVGIFLCRLCQHFEAETNSRYITNDIFECIFMNENIWISHKILLKFVRKCRIDNIPALVRCFRGN